jgi:sodium-dependent dicarboxylate transporter 2/3/5
MRQDRIRKIGFIAGIVLFLVIIFIPAEDKIETTARLTGACALLMATWWITEAVSLSVTALLPLVLFPVLKIMSTRDVVSAYADSNIFLFLGGFFIAIAMQRHNLHKRIALGIVAFLGSSQRRLILGFMIATAFLSMWISNTATAMMMLPIGIALTEHFIEKGRSNPENMFGAALMLGIAYSASIGGIGTLIGTPPNIIFAGMVKKLFPELPEIDFIHWMAIGIPIILLFIPIVWLILIKLWVPATGKKQPTPLIIREELRSLGKMTTGETTTLIIFVLTALGWIFRRDIVLGGFTLPGWAGLLGLSDQIDDSTVALIGAFLLFIIPTDIRKAQFVLNWEWAQKIPWGILILFGGGFALAAGFQASGLDKWIGSRFSGLSGFSPFLLVIFICLFLTFLTEITSNTASVSMILPILATMSAGLGINPMILMIPATLSASCAFMMPVATPPNAIVFGSGYLTMREMVKTGIILNFTGIFLITLIMYLVAFPMLGILIY